MIFIPFLPKSRKLKLLSNSATAGSMTWHAPGRWLQSRLCHSLALSLKLTVLLRMLFNGFGVTVGSAGLLKLTTRELRAGRLNCALGYRLLALSIGFLLKQEVKARGAPGPDSGLRGALVCLLCRSVDCCGRHSLSAC